MAINDEIGSTGSEMGTGGQKAVNAGRKTVNTAKKAVRGAKKIKKGYDLFKSGQLLKILLQKPGVWLSTIFGNLWWIMICFCLCLPLALINMGAEGITDSEAEGEAYEKMVKKVIRAFHNVDDGVGNIYTTADNYLQQYLDAYFPAKDKYKVDELADAGLTFPGADEELTANMAIGEEGSLNHPTPYYFDEEVAAIQYATYRTNISAPNVNEEDFEDSRRHFDYAMHSYTSVIRKPSTVEFPEEITPEEAIAIKYIAIDSVCKQYYLGDDEINLNDFEAILDTFFDTMTTDVGWDSIQTLFSYVDYGSYDENGVWHQFTSPSDPIHPFDIQSVKNNMSIKETGKYLVYNDGPGYNGQGQNVTVFNASGKANIWQGTVEISVRIRERNNFLRDKRDDIIQTMVDEDGLTEDEAVEKLGEMIDDMEQTIVSELVELHNQGIETDVSNASDGGADTPLGPSDGSRCFPDLDNETRYNRYSDGYEQLKGVMAQHNFSLWGGVIQCVDMARYCVCIQQDNMGYAWFSADGKDVARGLANAHPDDYQLVSRSEVISGSVLSMPTNGYGGPSGPGHVVYVEEVYSDGSMLITEGLPTDNYEYAYLMINRWVPSNYMAVEGVTHIAAPIN